MKIKKIIIEKNEQKSKRQKIKKEEIKMTKVERLGIIKLQN